MHIIKSINFLTRNLIISLLALKMYIFKLAKKKKTQDFCNLFIGKWDTVSHLEWHIWYLQPIAYQPLPSLFFLLGAFLECLLDAKHSAKPWVYYVPSMHASLPKVILPSPHFYRGENRSFKRASYFLKEVKKACRSHLSLIHTAASASSFISPFPQAATLDPP